MNAMPISRRRTTSPTNNPLDSDRAALRIGLFSESFRPVQNGVSTALMTLSSGLRERGHRVYVFAPEHQSQREPETGVMRFPSFVSSLNPEYPLAYPFLPRLTLAAHFRRLRMDIVHTHTPFVLGLTGANLAIRRQVPLVSTFHTLYSQYSHYAPMLPESVTLSLLEHYLPWYYNRVAEIICPSQIAAEHLRTLGVTQNITVIPTGIPLPAPEYTDETARQCARERIGIAPNVPLLLFAGRLAREKNVAHLLDVFARLHATAPASVLAIAGSGPYADELRRIAEELPCGGSVKFIGPVPRPQMDALYAAADVFCFPSPSETQGLVIGEARAAGTPCVAVRAGGAAETVCDGEDGLLVPPDDAGAFAAAIARILQNRDLQAKMRDAARRNACAYTPNRMIDRVLEVYEHARHAGPRLLPSVRAPQAQDWQTVGQAIIERE